MRAARGRCTHAAVQKAQTLVAGIMRLCSYITALVAWGAAARAAWLEDAFRKDWAVFSHGPLAHTGLVAADSLIASTADGELLAIDINRNASLRWKNDVAGVQGAARFVVAGPHVYTYAGGSEKVLVWDSASGTLVGAADLASTDVGAIGAVFPFDAGAVLVSGSRRSALVCSDGRVRLLDADIVSPIFLAQGENSNWVFSRNKIYSVTADENSVRYDVENSKVDAAQIGEATPKVAVVSSKVVDVRSGNTILSEKGIHLINSEFFYSHNGILKIFHNDRVVYSEPLEEFSRSSVIKNHLILSNSEEHRVLDLTDFLVNPDSSSLKVYSVAATSANDDVYIVDGVIIAISANDHSVEVSVLNEVSDKSISYSIALNTRKLSFPKALLINKPESKQTLVSIHHLLDEINKNAFVTRWLRRTRRHLSELGRFVSTKIFRSKAAGDKIEIANPFNLEKLLIFVDRSSLVAIDSLDGSAVWEIGIKDGLKDLIEVNQQIALVYPSEIIILESRDGQVVETIQPNFKFDKVVKLAGDEDTLVARSGYEIKPFHETEFHGECFVEHGEDFIQGLQIINSKLVPTWKFQRQSIVAVAQKPADSETASVGIGLHDRSVLYKFSTKNTVTAIVKENGLHKLYLLNGIDGSILYSHEHEQSFDDKSLKVLIDDNWIIYSYFEPSTQLQKFTVVDLFKDKEGQLSHSIKSYIFPERIVELSSTYTKLGITIKSIIALTVNGDLIEIPKYVLNSRRIADHVLTQKDYQDDFRMTPYHPVIPRNNFQVLNHQYSLQPSDINIILVKPTSLESTSIVCLVNDKNQFCTKIQPSSAYDILNESFDRIKLVLTIVVVLAIYVVTNPWVFRKNLDDNWIYNEN